MGFFKKALGKSVGRKLLGKAIKKDPIASKLIKKDPLGSKLIGSTNGTRSGSPKKSLGSLAGAVKARAMGTGGNMPPERITPAAKKMSRVGMSDRPRRAKFNP